MENLSYDLSQVWRDSYKGDNKRPNEWRTKVAINMRNMGKVVSIQGKGTFSDKDGFLAYWHWVEGIPYKPTNYGLEEYIAISTIEQLLGRGLSKQHKVGVYYIDAYDEITNIAYKIDEVQHSKVEHLSG